MYTNIIYYYSFFVQDKHIRKINFSYIYFLISKIRTITPIELHTPNT